MYSDRRAKNGRKDVHNNAEGRIFILKAN